MTLPARIHLSRRAGWRMPPNTVKVDRSTRLGNPWKIGSPGIIDMRAMPSLYLLPLAMDRRSSVEAYRLWLEGQREWWTRPNALTFNEYGWEVFWREWEQGRALILSRLPELRGRDLACWCPTDCPCHADVLLEAANA